MHTSRSAAASEVVPVPGSHVSIGARMKTARKRLAMTLEELSQSTGLTKGYLSRVERNLKTPALATILKVSHSLRMSVSELMGEHLSPQTIKVTRAGTGKKVANRFSGVELLVPGGSDINAFIVRPDREFGEERLREHSGEELIYVLSGNIELSFSNRKIVLRRGDCVRFPGHVRHRMRSIGTAEAAALTVVAGQ
ncbi:MAG: XRE family transcriptional regulator [Bradyrhizobiaceae bacterium]|nr:MAG: XRE family transcriptional regulator [Bradyrhizobiaceae bacterium]